MQQNDSLVDGYQALTFATRGAAQLYRHELVRARLPPLLPRRPSAPPPAPYSCSRDLR